MTTDPTNEASPSSNPAELQPAIPTTRQLQQAIAESETFVKLVAENLRYGSWTKRFLTVGGIVAVLLNPISVGKMAESMGFKELPKWYTTAFFAGMGGLGVGAIAAPGFCKGCIPDVAAPETRFLVPRDLKWNTPWVNPV